jgi:hypothetical protein
MRKLESNRDVSYGSARAVSNRDAEFARAESNAQAPRRGRQERAIVSSSGSVKNAALSLSSNSEVRRSAVCFRAQTVNTF